MALSWEALEAIGEELEALEGSRLTKAIEYGSGISTYLLATHGRTTGTTVESYDSDPNWAAKTNSFLHKHGLESFVVVLHAETVTHQSPADFILWDFDRNPKRVDLIAAAYGNLLPGGVMYIDDMQNAEIRAACTSLEGEIIRTVTEDSFGRYGVFIRKPL